jgi:hypothetical protein
MTFLLSKDLCCDCLAGGLLRKRLRGYTRLVRAVTWRAAKKLWGSWELSKFCRFVARGMAKLFETSRSQESDRMTAELLESESLGLQSIGGIQKEESYA